MARAAGTGQTPPGHASSLGVDPPQGPPLAHDAQHAPPCSSAWPARADGGAGIGARRVAPWISASGDIDPKGVPACRPIPTMSTTCATDLLQQLMGTRVGVDAVARQARGVV